MNEVCGVDVYSNACNDKLTNELNEKIIFNKDNGVLVRDIKYSSSFNGMYVVFSALIIWEV